MAKRVIYRDLLTGHFVSGGTWFRGGDRYVRQSVETEAPEEPEEEYESWRDFLEDYSGEENEEITGSADYARKSH